MKSFKTKIFLDSGDPLETSKTKNLLGFLDGQTTNPTLFAKSPEVVKMVNQGKKFTAGEIYDFYKKIVKDISGQIPNGSVSIEVYADNKTTVEEIIRDCRNFSKWIPNAHIKLPITKEGLKAANLAVKEGIRVNMTLCFSQEQAAAVYNATKGAKKGQVYISPFIGRLDDIGENGLDLILNILKMYKQGDGHVEVLAASIRSLDHFLSCLEMECDIITAPYSVLEAWVKEGFSVNKPKEALAKLKKIIYNSAPLLKEKWNSTYFRHPLTDKGIERFCSDWKGLLS